MCMRCFYIISYIYSLLLFFFLKKKIEILIKILNACETFIKKNYIYVRLKYFFKPKPTTTNQTKKISEHINKKA
jgi:hypothetical protein